MKKTLITSLYVLINTYSTIAQNLPVSQAVQKKTIVLEEFTGIKCQFCPDGHRRAKEIEESNPGKVILVNIHAGSYSVPSAGQPDLRTSAGNSLASWMQVGSYPSGAVQRREQSGELSVSRSLWEGIANTVKTENSPVNVALNAVINEQTRVVTVNVEIFYTSPFASGTNHYLNVGFLQNDFEGPQTGSSNNPDAVLSNGKYLHQHIFRGYINTGGVNGHLIDPSSTGVISKTYTYTIPENINSVPVDINKLSFFAFVGEGKKQMNNSNIFSGAKVNPTFTASLNDVVKNNLQVYPLPANSSINLNFDAFEDEYKITLKDLLGKEIVVKSLNNVTGYQNINIPLEGIASGNYILILESKSEKISESIIIE